jgi:hypothetical protein
MADQVSCCGSDPSAGRDCGGTPLDNGMLTGVADGERRAAFTPH